MRSIVTKLQNGRFALAAAVLVTIVGAWLSQGTLAATGAGAGRVAIVPVTAGAIAVAIAAGAAVVAAARAGAPLTPYALLVFVLLPWLPAPVPAALLTWAGPLGWLVWLAIALLVIASIAGGGKLRPYALGIRLRPPVAAALAAAAISLVSAWQVSPSIPGGDEPHYLIITQSLLKDHDLKIENNHRQGDYQAYFPGDLSKPDYRRRGRNGEIYSIHAPGLPALIAPAFAIGGYYGVVLFLIALASAASGLAWHLAHKVTGRRDAAWFGWAAVTLSVTGIFHSFSIYPDGPGGAIVLTGVWALLRIDDEAVNGSEAVLPWFFHGIALALLPWLHSRFAVLAGGLGALVLLRLAATRNPAGKAVAFLIVPALGALAWIGFFIAIYGTPDPSAPYANEVASAAFVPGGLAGLFFDQRFGLLAYAPVLGFAFGGLVVMVAARAYRRLGLELVFVMAPYLIAVTYFAMWWGGQSAPARFFAPMLPAMAIPAAVAWSAITRRTTRAAAIGALAFTAFASAALVCRDGGRLAFNIRQTYAYWLDWLNPAVDLAHGLPSWWRDREHEIARDTAIWCAALAAAWGTLSAGERLPPLRARAAFGTAAAAVFAVAAMAALAVVQAMAHAGAPAGPPDLTASQMQLLRRVATVPHALTFELPPFRRIARETVASRLHITPRAPLEPGGAGLNDRPLFAIPAVPAGRYRLDFQARQGDGWVMLGIGRDQFSLRTQPLGSPPASIVLDFPVDVRWIMVRADEQARRRVNGLTIEPQSLVPPAAKLTSDVARRGVRYGAASVFFLDDRGFAEAEAFWVGGGRSTSIVVQPDAPRQTTALHVRNAPVDNRLSIESGKWRQDLQLGPGEERRVEVPMDVRRGATLVTLVSASGFRPSALDPNSRDNRFLGVWVKLE